MHTQTCNLEHQGLTCKACVPAGVQAASALLQATCKGSAQTGMARGEGKVRQDGLLQFAHDAHASCDLDSLKSPELPSAEQCSRLAHGGKTE